MDFKYVNTIMYMIQHMNDKKLIYLGSTTDFHKREITHRHDYIKHPTRKVYKMIYENGGIEKFNFIKIKEFPCKNKKEALEEEQRLIVEYEATMNSCSATSGCETLKEYYQVNKEKIKEKTKAYQEANKDKINEKYREKIICECGIQYSYGDKARHFKSKRHIDYLEPPKKRLNDKKNEKFMCECGIQYTHKHKARHSKSKRHIAYLDTI